MAPPMIGGKKLDPDAEVAYNLCNELHSYLRVDYPNLPQTHAQVWEKLIAGLKMHVCRANSYPGWPVYKEFINFLMGFYMGFYQLAQQGSPSFEPLTIKILLVVDNLYKNLTRSFRRTLAIYEAQIEFLKKFGTKINDDNKTVIRNHHNILVEDFGDQPVNKNVWSYLFDFEYSAETPKRARENVEKSIGSYDGVNIKEIYIYWIQKELKLAEIISPQEEAALKKCQQACYRILKKIASTNATNSLAFMQHLKEEIVKMQLQSAIAQEVILALKRNIAFVRHLKQFNKGFMKFEAKMQERILDKETNEKLTTSMNEKLKALNYPYNLTVKFLRYYPDLEKMYRGGNIDLFSEKCIAAWVHLLKIYWIKREDGWTEEEMKKERGYYLNLYDTAQSNLPSLKKILLFARDMYPNSYFLSKESLIHRLTTDRICYNILLLENTLKCLLDMMQRKSLTEAETVNELKDIYAALEAHKNPIFDMNYFIEFFKNWCLFHTKLFNYFLNLFIESTFDPQNQYNGNVEEEYELIEGRKKLIRKVKFKSVETIRKIIDLQSKIPEKIYEKRELNTTIFWIGHLAENHSDPQHWYEYLEYLEQTKSRYRAKFIAEAYANVKKAIGVELFDNYLKKIWNDVDDKNHMNPKGSGTDEMELGLGSLGPFDIKIKEEVL